MGLRSMMSRVLVIGSAIAVGIMLLLGGDGAAGTLSTIPSSASARAAASELSTISIKARGPKTGYARDQFGQVWADVDRNGCDTRNDILARDLIDPQFKVGTGNCVVLLGTLFDPYTGKTIEFTKANAAAVQIDHIVPLSLSWQTGAVRWDQEKRQRFANDPINLLAVDGPTNAAKGDSSPSAWMPPARSHWCDYSTRFIAVVAAYGLTITQADHDMLARGLGTCEVGNEDETE